MRTLTIKINKMQNSEVQQNLTLGQKAVGLTFNHGEGVVFERVNKIKLLCAELIDLVEDTHKEKTNPSWFSNVFRTAAFNALIAAQMASVKYVTWKD